METQSTSSCMEMEIPPFCLVLSIGANKYMIFDEDVRLIHALQVKSKVLEDQKTVLLI